MCDTIAKRIQRHEENAVRELRVKLQAEEDKQYNFSTQNERLISSKIGKLDFLFDGGHWPYAGHRKDKNERTQ